MANKVCESCKPGKPGQKQEVADAEANSAVAQTGCSDLYKVVSECMTKYNGNISDCKNEWKEFQKCLKMNKKE